MSDSRIIPESFGEYITARDDAGTPVTLGSGGFGTTVRAYRSRMLAGSEIRDDYAIKILHTKGNDDPKWRTSFIKEILALRELYHPNLVRYVDCGEQAGSIYLVMELCKGGDLERLAQDFGAFNERSALTVLRQICEGLREAHRKDFVHRDLKPRNVLLRELVAENAGAEWLNTAVLEDRLCFKVVDFGLAGRLSGEVRAAGFAGSPMFASPEQVRERGLDARSDIYSLGMTIWSIVAGRGPLLNSDGRTLEDAREAMKAHTSPNEHEANLPRNLSAAFRALLARMVRKAPEERFASASQLLEEIAKIPVSPERTEFSSGETGDDLSEEFDLAERPDWATGSFGDYFEIRSELGRRSIAKFYLAKSKQSESEVGLTAWVPGLSPDTATEHKLAAHLGHIWSITASSVAPPSLTRISEVRRTASEWCVAEEWHGLLSLGDLLSQRGRSLTVEEIMLLLWPVAEASDFLLTNNVTHGRLSISDIRLQAEEMAKKAPDWLQTPVDRWSDWHVQVSALTIPPEFTGGMTQNVDAGHTLTESVFLDGESEYPLAKSFCRLLYRMVEGSEVAAFADWDANSYSEATRLSAQSNFLLRDTICGQREVPSVTKLLKRICHNEGIFRFPGESTYGTGRSFESEGSAKRSRPSERSTLPGAARSSMGPGKSSRLDPKGSSPATGSARSSGSREAASMLSVMGTTRIEVAELVPGAPGTVRSPYGNRPEQKVAGPEWRAGGKVYSPEAGQLFQLPEELPPLDAMLIEGRFDAVHSPYTEPPTEVPVPLGRWKAEEEMACPSTGLALKLPKSLPLPIATLVPGKPGSIRSPYGAHSELKIDAAEWEPGRALTCLESGQLFVLPDPLPALAATPMETTGTFTSPYAGEQRFTLPPHECFRGFAFKCPFSEKPLVVPSTLPANWRFEGRVRQGAEPEAQSPFVRDEQAYWQPLTAKQWKPGTGIQCARTAREFVLPEVLPVLRVDPAPNPPAIRSPFAPHDAVPVPPEDWRPGSEIDLKISETVCRVALPEGSVPALPAIADAEAGTFSSPYAPTKFFSLPPWDCLPGAALPCPATGSPMVLPQTLPATWRWEATLRQNDVPEARSPYIADDAMAWQPLAAAEWVPGAVVRCRQTKRDFTLPRPLPPLHVKLGQKAPSIRSPFPPHESLPVKAEKWHRNTEVEVRLGSGQLATVILPPDVQPLGKADEEELVDLPLGFEPQVRGRIGAIRSPHGDQPWLEVPAKDWLTGTRCLCPSTRKPLWLPDNLPPIEARLGPKPPAVWSPYTDRAVEIPPFKWLPGSLHTCPETNALFTLPPVLPLLPGRVDPARPGFVESPFLPGDFFACKITDWVPGAEIVCPSSGNKFVLPPSLPEWIAEAEVVTPALGMVRSPFARQTTFKVPGEQWVAGGFIVCPQTAQRLRLPKDLPPMTAVAPPAKPGFIVSPYDTAQRDFKIPKNSWVPGFTISCPATGRPLQLPEPLPAWPRGAGLGKAALVGVAAVVLLLAIGAAWSFLRQSPEPTIAVATPSPATPAAVATPAPATPAFVVATPAFAPATPKPMPLGPQTGFAKLAGARWPLFTSLRYILQASRGESVSAEQPMKSDEPLELKPGRYRLEAFVDSGSAGAIDVAPRRVPTEVTIGAGKTADVTLPPFDFPQTMMGYVRVEWHDTPLRFFRSADGNKYPLGELQSIQFDTWTPIVVQFDPSYTSGELYEAHNMATSLVVFALDGMLNGVEKSTSAAIESEGAKLLRSLELPAGPTPEWAVDSAAAFVKSANALKNVAAGNKIASEAATNGKRMMDFFTTIAPAMTTPAWKHLAEACLSQKPLAAADLLELTKVPKGNKLGYLVHSHFVVKSSESDGSLGLEIKRHNADLRSWGDAEETRWAASLRSTKMAADRYSFRLSGRWLGDPCTMELQASVLK